MSTRRLATPEALPPTLHRPLGETALSPERVGRIQDLLEALYHQVLPPTSRVEFTTPQNTIAVVAEFQAKLNRVQQLLQQGYTSPYGEGKSTRTELDTLKDHELMFLFFSDKLELSPRTNLRDTQPTLIQNFYQSLSSSLEAIRLTDNQVDHAATLYQVFGTEYQVLRKVILEAWQSVEQDGSNAKISITAFTELTTGRNPFFLEFFTAATNLLYQASPDRDKDLLHPIRSQFDEWLQLTLRYRKMTANQPEEAAWALECFVSEMQLITLELSREWDSGQILTASFVQKFVNDYMIPVGSTHLTTLRQLFENPESTR